MRNKKKNTTQKRQKGGISLIVLVITIIVMVILAAAVIVSVNNTGIFGKAKEAVERQKKTEYMTVIQTLLIQAKGDSLQNGTDYLVEAKTLLEANETFKEATISEVASGQFTITTKENWVYTITRAGVTLVENNEGQGGNGGNGEPEPQEPAVTKVTLTVEYIGPDNSALATPVTEEYTAGTYAHIESVSVDDYTIDTVTIVANETTEVEAVGSSFTIDLPMNVNTTITIKYKVQTGTEEPVEVPEQAPVTNTQGATGQKVAVVNKTYTATASDKTSLKLSDNAGEDKYWTQDITPVGENGPLTITFDVSDKAENGDYILVHHKIESTSVWENLGDYLVADGKITVTIENFSPFVFVVKKQNKEYSITSTTTNVTGAVTNVTKMKWKDTVTLTYTANSDYILPETISVTGATSTWDKTTGTLTLTNPTGNVAVSVPGWDSQVVTAIVDTVPIPRGFVASPYSDENTKEQGLVIYELASGETAIPSTETQHTSWTTRNQYVWVPVNNFETEFVRTSYDGGKPTNTLGETTISFWEVTLDMTTNLPLSTQDSAYMSSTTLAEVQSMYASVKKYGGFYVARYEMGISSRRTSNTTLITGNSNVHSKMNKIPYNYLSWASSKTMNVDTGGAVAVARSIYPSSSSYGVVSTLMYEVQWDTTINWIANTKLADGVTAKYPNILTDSTSYGNGKQHVITSKDDLNTGASYAVYDSSGDGSLGNYTQVTAESTISKPKAFVWALTTGALKAAKTNNIYDLVGNMAEWTMGGMYNCYRVARGNKCTGEFDFNLKVHDLYPVDGQMAYSLDLSARVALYIK